MVKAIWQDVILHDTKILGLTRWQTLVIILKNEQY
jgi:hypothetical protein